MAYQVLARKWRPRNFQQMVGQEHVLQALINALSHNRLHHAYLFTGTRGVGKTTITRIFAKSLNCEMGVTATPCGQCSICCQIDAGTFVDLIEIDAASRTKVEDTRELLDSVQYVPHVGRYKVYVIDEVHMLSGHSFNALLKTLEEPPEHTKFLLATTDPQKIPITVLSRCLQFHLKHLSTQQITDHLAYISNEEKVIYQLPALRKIAKAANGSMRDALSLLDQSIAFSDHDITSAKIDLLLGSIETIYFYRLVDALCAKDIQQVFLSIHEIAEHTSNFAQVLEELLLLLHQMAVIQLVPNVSVDFPDTEKLTAWTNSLTPEEIQLFYQIALIGRRDLPLAPSLRTGFEMVLLRMLFFSPEKDIAPLQTSVLKVLPQEPVDSPLSHSNLVSKDVILPKSDKTTEWSEILDQLNLTGITKTLASYCVIKEMTETNMHLVLDSSQAILLNEKQRERLEQGLNNFYGVTRKLVISTGENLTSSPAIVEKTKIAKEKQAALENVNQDPQAQMILKAFDITLKPEHIKI